MPDIPHWKEQEGASREGGGESEKGASNPEKKGTGEQGVKKGWGLQRPKKFGSKMRRNLTVPS